DGASNEALDLLLVGHIGSNEYRLATFVSDAVSDGLPTLGAACGQYDFRTFLGRFDRGSLADAGCSSGDNNGFTLQHAHFVLLAVLSFRVERVGKARIKWALCNVLAQQKELTCPPNLLNGPSCVGLLRTGTCSSPSLGIRCLS